MSFNYFHTQSVLEFQPNINLASSSLQDGSKVALLLQGTSQPSSLLVKWNKLANSGFKIGYGQTGTDKNKEKVTYRSLGLCLNQKG
jgi:hypothetical protein